MILHRLVRVHQAVYRRRPRLLPDGALHHSSRRRAAGETQVVVRFWIVTMLRAWSALARLKVRSMDFGSRRRSRCSCYGLGGGAPRDGALVHTTQRARSASRARASDPPQADTLAPAAETAAGPAELLAAAGWPLSARTASELGAEDTGIAPHDERVAPLLHDAREHGVALAGAKLDLLRAHAGPTWESQRRLRAAAAGRSPAPTAATTTASTTLLVERADETITMAATSARRCSTR